MPGVSLCYQGSRWKQSKVKQAHDENESWYTQLLAESISLDYRNDCELLLCTVTRL